VLFYADTDTAGVVWPLGRWVRPLWPR